LDVHVPQGNIQDFIQIFDVLTQKLNWFPRKLNGLFSGNLKIRGGVSFSELQISSQIEGQNWEIFGERFKSAQLIGGYDRGKYYLEDFNLVKQGGQIKGSVSYEESGKIQWKLRTKDLSVSDFDHLAQSDIPLRGDIQLQSEGIGNLDRVESATECSLTRLSIRGMPMAASQSSLTTHLGVASLKGSFFGREAEFNANYDSNPKNVSRVQMALNQLDFSPLLLLLNKKNLQDPRLAASFSGGLDLAFRAGEFDQANGFFELNDFLLARSDVRFQLDHPVSVDVTEGNFDANQLSLVGKSKKVTLDLKSKGSSLSGRVTGELDNALLYFFIPSIAQVRGASSLDFDIAGTNKDPTIVGEARLSGGELRVESLESPFENLTGSIRLNQNEVTLKGVQADLGGGRVLLSGRVLLNPQRSPGVSVKIAIQEAKVKVYPFQSVKLAGQLGVSGVTAPYLIDGSLTVDSALFREKMLSQKRSSEGLKASQYLPQSNAAGDTQVSLFNLNVDLDAPKGVLVQNDLFRDVVAKGKMTLVNTLDTPRVLGKLEIEQGKLVFKDHVFQIQSATALFDSPTVLNPSFDLVANTEASGIKIQMFASGRKTDMKIEMTSSPAMQEAEIFSLLALGMTPSETKRLSASDLGLIQQGEAASLVLNSLDFNRELEDKTGLQLKVDESVNRQQGASAFRAQNQNEAAPQITVKRKFGDRFSVSAGSTIGMGSTKSNQINLDFNVNPNFSINGIYNNYGANTTGGSGAYGATDAQAAQIQNSWGLDLKFLKRFK
jgi:translocation and assembly module TamB